MTNGLFSDMFVQAEIDYRRDRALSDTHPAPRTERTRAHRRWHFSRSTRPVLRAQGCVE
jgi:hypothetical protein